MNQFWQRRDFSASTVKIYWILESQLFSKALHVMGFALMLSLKKKKQKKQKQNKKNKTKQNYHQCKDFPGGTSGKTRLPVRRC